MPTLSAKDIARLFSPLPVNLQRAVGTRMAMRAVPILAASTGASRRGFDYWRSDKRAQHTLAVFRAYQVTISTEFTGSSWDRDTVTASAVAAAAADFAEGLPNTKSRLPEVQATLTAATLVARLLDASTTADRVAAIADAANSVNHAFYNDGQSRASAAAAFNGDLAFVRSAGPQASPSQVSDELSTRPLWAGSTPSTINRLWERLQQDALNLNAGFEIWLEWYRDRLEGKPIDRRLEERWATISRERLAQRPSEINAYLKSLRDGLAQKQLNRVRAIFIGHGGVGKTSIISALHGDDVVEGAQAMTKGIAIQDSTRNPAEQTIHEDAGVFTRTKSFDDRDLIVHFWDFGGQVMAHATHQFFLRARCLYVIVLDARKERNANEEAEYWLEHVRAFGENAPVLLVGNKADQVSVNLDLSSLREKYKNVRDFYPISCTEAKGRFRAEFDRFSRDFNEAMVDIGVQGERFTESQFRVLRQVQVLATKGDFLSHDIFDRICIENGISRTGPQGRDQLLDLFDKLGIVMYFPRLPFLTDFVLNPRWLTYGVYTIMYSELAQAAKGRITESEVVQILKNAALTDARGRRTLLYPPDRCRLIVEAMVAFGVAYRLANDSSRLVIPALLEPQQPSHDFKSEGAIAFQLDFKGFLPRHVLPTMIVDNHVDIAKTGAGREVVWQNGALLRPGRGIDAEALVKADYHERNLNVLVSGSDANTYLGQIRDSILKTLQTMPDLRYDENVRLRPDMKLMRDGLPQPSERSIWMDYKTIRVAQKNKMKAIAGPDGIYDLDKILAVMPVPAELRAADVFISYSSKDRPIVEELANKIEGTGYSVWFDRDLIGSQQYRDVIDQRIDAAKAVIALWTKNSVGSRYVRHEASRAADQNKLICIRAKDVKVNDVPGPFPANDHFLLLGNDDALLKAFELLGLTSN